MCDQQFDARGLASIDRLLCLLHSARQRLLTYHVPARARRRDYQLRVRIGRGAYVKHVDSRKQCLNVGKHFSPILLGQLPCGARAVGQKSGDRRAGSGPAFGMRRAHEPNASDSYAHLAAPSLMRSDDFTTKDTKN